MMQRTVVDLSCVPKFASHVRLRFDNVRDVWTIQAPERTFLLDDAAHAVISRCDGAQSLSAVIDAVCEIYEGERAAVEADVIELVQDFVDKGVLTL